MDEEHMVRDPRHEYLDGCNQGDYTSKPDLSALMEAVDVLIPSVVAGKSP